MHTMKSFREGATQTGLVRGDARAREKRPVRHDAKPRGRAATMGFAQAARAGLSRADKQLPAWLFYDEEGSRLFERITELPEYYPSRVERRIFEAHGDSIARVSAAGAHAPLHVAELGAGTATKTQVLLEAVVRLQGDTTFLATDVSATPLQIAAERLAREEPRVRTEQVVGPHEHALGAIRALEDRQMVLFIGSSIGNYVGDEALSLVRSVRGAVREGAAFVLGTDLRKDPRVLVAAYDDAQGVTAAFNKNVLARINRELGGHFDLARFDHVALWNDEASRIEMHLESTVEQVVVIDALEMRIAFAKGERIHTESSVKYDEERVDALLAAGGFKRLETFCDDEKRFAVHVARAV